MPPNIGQWYWLRLSSTTLLAIQFALLLFAAYAAPEVRAVCTLRQWMCGSYECIERTRLCDGRVHCADGSDETLRVCSANRCPGYAFRCAYGGCIAARKECNGNADCVDGSDEANCTSTTTVGADDTVTDVSPVSADGERRCGVGRFACKTNDRCVRSDQMCDGRRDCPDGSDETTELCWRNHCPEYAFRCGYGGCVHRRAQCNGTVECADASDESAQLCGVASVLPATSTSPPVQPDDNEVRRPSTEPPTAGRCRLHFDTNVRAFNAANTSIQLPAGLLVEPWTIVQFRCEASLHLTNADAEHNVCVPDGGWQQPMPICESRCDGRRLLSASTQVVCEFERLAIRCDSPNGLPHGTFARVLCQYGYRKPYGPVNDQLVCAADGVYSVWNASPMRCEQVCGMDNAPAGTAYIVGGEVQNNTLVPWHVGIYSDVEQEGRFAQICGGSILTNRLVISAAHCFFSKADDRFRPAEHFRVATGKYYRDWYANDEPLAVGRYAVQHIRHVRGYQDYKDLYNADVALLLLSETIVFHSYVVPVCLELNLQHNQKYIESDESALVAGWGLTESGGQSSDVLKVLELPTVSSERCKPAVPANFRRYVTTDKFCGGFVNSERSVCRGDSGGGLVTWRTAPNGVRTYFLSGLVSSGPNYQDSCDSNSYAVFTNVHFYDSLIEEVIAESVR